MCLADAVRLHQPACQRHRLSPYYRADDPENGGLEKEDELVMSDIPWAVAWYGKGNPSG